MSKERGPGSHPVRISELLKGSSALGGQSTKRVFWALDQLQISLAKPDSVEGPDQGPVRPRDPSLSVDAAEATLTRTPDRLSRWKNPSLTSRP